MRAMIPQGTMPRCGACRTTLFASGGRVETKGVPPGGFWASDLELTEHADPGLQ